MPRQSSGRKLAPVVVVGIVAALGLAVFAMYAARQPEPALDSAPPADVQVTAADPAAPPPVLLALPEFQLTERSGQPLTSQQLRGQVWIADFIFTRCAGPCSIMTSKMASLQKKYQDQPGWDRVRLVSFSVDPDYDTPEVMQEYASRFKADPDHWLFATGSRKDLWTLCTEGFKLTVEENIDDASMPFMHSTRFVLVDTQGRVRGYYDGTDDDDLQKLDRDLQRLLHEPS